MKRIVYGVVAVHLSLILWMNMWTPVKKEKSKSIKVHTVVRAPPKESVMVAAKASPKPAVKALANIKKIAPPPKKGAAAKKPVKKKPAVSQDVQKQLQESIAKFSQNSHKELPKVTLDVPKQIAHLEVDVGIKDEVNTFVATLIECLQHTLKLPEKGDVKVELTLKQEGHFVKLHVLEAESQLNARFLEQQLPMITYPSFTGGLKKEKEHTFVISFCNF